MFWNIKDNLENTLRIQSFSIYEFHLDKLKLVRLEKIKLQNEVNPGKNY